MRLHHGSCTAFWNTITWSRWPCIGTKITRKRSGKTSLPQFLNFICLLEPKLRKASASMDSIIDFVILKSWVFTWTAVQCNWRVDKIEFIAGSPSKSAILLNGKTIGRSCVTLGTYDCGVSSHFLSLLPEMSRGTPGMIVRNYLQKSLV